MLGDLSRIILCITGRAVLRDVLTPLDFINRLAELQIRTTIVEPLLLRPHRRRRSSGRANAARHQHRQRDWSIQTCLLFTVDRPCNPSHCTPADDSHECYLHRHTFDLRSSTDNPHHRNRPHARSAQSDVLWRHRKEGEVVYVSADLLGL